MSQIKVENIYTITDEDIDDIMCSALEGGITYWCRQVDVVGKFLGDYASEQISRGGELILWDSEEDNVTYVLNKEMLLNGVELAIINREYEEYEWHENGGLNCAQIDADVADCIIQYALFGKIIFA